MVLMIMLLMMVAVVMGVHPPTCSHQKRQEAYAEVAKIMQDEFGKTDEVTMALSRSAIQQLAGPTVANLPIPDGPFSPISL